MLRVLEPAPHATRRRELGERHTGQERFMQRALQNLQAQLDERQHRGSAHDANGATTEFDIEERLGA